LFNKGDEVVVVKLGLQSYGLTGFVVEASSKLLSNNVLVYFEDWNGMGEKELWFRPDNLKFKGEDNMAVKGVYNIAMVKHVKGVDTNKKYAFALFDDSICVNDLVLCDSDSSYSVAKVVEIIPQHEYNGATVTKEIICKVDFTDYEVRKERRNQKAALKKQMDKMVKDNQELILYQAIAEKNPEMAELLTAYKTLEDV
jgi:hypothetical protein